MIFFLREVAGRASNIYRLVDEEDISYHAGFGKMPDGYNAINHRSLGIELINSEKEGPSDAQYNALVTLVQDIRSRHRIRYIRGHSHIAPARKSDPWLFNWKRFNELLGNSNGA